jgi:hypothetical protein
VSSYHLPHTGHGVALLDELVTKQASHDHVLVIWGGAQQVRHARDELCSQRVADDRVVALAGDGASRGNGQRRVRVRIHRLRRHWLAVTNNRSVHLVWTTGNIGGGDTNHDGVGGGIGHPVGSSNTNGWWPVICAMDDSTQVDTMQA